jgi:hypothetical protein
MSNQGLGEHVGCRDPPRSCWSRLCRSSGIATASRARSLPLSNPQLTRWRELTARSTPILHTSHRCWKGRGAAARPPIGSVLLAARAEAATCSSRRQSRAEPPPRSWSRKSPLAQPIASSATRPRRRPGLGPCFAASTGAADVLAAGSIGRVLQAHLAVARVAGAATHVDAHLAAGQDESQEVGAPGANALLLAAKQPRASRPTDCCYRRRAAAREEVPTERPALIRRRTGILAPR